MNTASIIFPARSRIILTEDLLLSIEARTKNKHLIDVVGICDHDDHETISLFQKIAPKLSYEFKFISQPLRASLDLPNNYYGPGLKLSKDSYFKWILGNDCSIETQDWDLELEKIISLEDFKSDFISNKYYYIAISDDTHWKGGVRLREHAHTECCCFPIVSSNYCLDLNEFYPREFPTWGGDTKLFSLVKNSKKFTILNYQNKISILHRSYHNKSWEKDEISLKMEQSKQRTYDDWNSGSLAGLLPDITMKRLTFLFEEEERTERVAREIITSSILNSL